MSVNPVSNSNANAISSAASSYIKQVTGAGSSTDTSTALEESTETAATTTQEAAHGDPVAKRLIARQQQQKQLQNPTPTTPPAPAQELGKGQQVDQQA